MLNLCKSPEPIPKVSSMIACVSLMLYEKVNERMYCERLYIYLKGKGREGMRERGAVSSVWIYVICAFVIEDL